MGSETPDDRTDPGRVGNTTVSGPRTTVNGSPGVPSGTLLASRGAGEERRAGSTGTNWEGEGSGDREIYQGLGPKRRIVDGKGFGSNRCVLVWVVFSVDEEEVGRAGRFRGGRGITNGKGILSNRLRVPSLDPGVCFLELTPEDPPFVPIPPVIPTTPSTPAVDPPSPQSDVSCNEDGVLRGSGSLLDFDVDHRCHSPSFPKRLHVLVARTPHLLPPS